MVVMVLERVGTSLRGELTRWLVEARTGVFVGTVGAEVRERLWRKVCEGRGSGAAVLAYRADTEQGFALRACGDPSRELVDFDGLQLVRIPD